MQEDMKEEPVEITYSYWDGSGHRKTVSVRLKASGHRPDAPLQSADSFRFDPLGLCRSQCKKGDTIAQFLDKCRQQFPELRAVSVDNLMYIKEDLIIPHVRVAASLGDFAQRADLFPLLQHYTFCSYRHYPCLSTGILL